jgi:hypothetical protein
MTIKNVPYVVKVDFGDIGSFKCVLIAEDEEVRNFVEGLKATVESYIKDSGMTCYEIEDNNDA